MRWFHWFAAILSSAACAAWAQSYTWTDVSPGGGIFVQDVEIQPFDGRIIVRGYFGGTVSLSETMTSSRDGGRTWSAPVSPVDRITSMLIHPGVPGLVFVESSGHNAQGLVYRSNDFGFSWSLVHMIDVGGSIRLAAPDPENTGGLYAMQGQYFGVPPVACPNCGGLSELGITRTQDAGSNWSAPVATNTTVGWPIQGPTPSAPNRLFRGSYDGVIVSQDKAATWARFQTSLPTPLRWIVADPINPSILYGARLDQPSPDVYQYPFMRSDDNGVTWRELFRSRGSDPSVFIDQARPNIVWLIDWQAETMYRSDNRGGNWHAVPWPVTRSPDPTFSWPRTLVLSAAEPGVIYMVQKNRLFRGVPSVAPDPVIAEFEYESDRYWLTSLDGEAVSQDYRVEPGNVHRTGQRWGAWRAEDAPAGAVGSCRFWPRPESGLRTRVLVLRGFECDALKADSNWILEGENEFYAVPPTGDSCPAGLWAVRRFHNLKPDLNHRWVADPNIANEMRARGWYDEGVRFCSRPFGPNE